MTRPHSPEWSTLLFDASGARKYVSASEFPRFLAAAWKSERRTRLFCLLLAYSGCRISEALAVTRDHIDAETRCVVFRTLKRRKRVFRAVPVPGFLICELSALGGCSAPSDRLWPWSRATGWRRVKAVMALAGIVGSHAMPKGLRHGFGIANAEHKVPPGITQKWMGHARLETTCGYQHAVGSEERAFARRMWEKTTMPSITEKAKRLR